MSSFTQDMIRDDWRERLFSDINASDFYLDDDEDYNFKNVDVMDIIEESFDSDEVTRDPLLSSGAKKIMISTNPKTRKMYAEKFSEYEIFCKVSNLPITKQNKLCNYLHDIIEQR